MPSEAELRNDRYQRFWAKVHTAPHILVCGAFALAAAFLSLFAIIKYNPHTLIWFEIISLICAGVSYDTWMRYCQAEWAPREFSTAEGSSDWATLDELNILFGPKTREAPDRAERRLLRHVPGSTTLVHGS